VKVATNLAHRIDRGRYGDVLVEQPSPKDVLDHHGRIIDQNADSEDECKQAHPIDAEVQHPGRPDRDQDHHGNHHDHNDRCAQPDRDQAQQAHGHRGLQQGKEQLVDLVGCRLAIVATDGHMHVRRDEPVVQRVDALEQLLGDHDPVGTLLLGDRHGDCIGPVRCASVTGMRRPGVEGYDLVRLRRALGHLREIADIDRGAVMGSDQQGADLLRRAEECAGSDLEVVVGFLDVADALAGVRRTDRSGELVEADPVTLQAFGQYPDLYLILRAANDKAPAGIRHLFQTLHHLKCNPPQADVVDRMRPQGQGDDRYIIDPLRLHQWRRDARWDLVEIRLQLVVHLDDRFAEVLADLETDRHHALFALGRRVHVLDTRDLAHHALQRVDRHSGDLPGRGTGVLDEHVDHRHRDLRILLPRGHDQAK
jgi:hypothetical protein